MKTTMIHKSLIVSAVVCAFMMLPVSLIQAKEHKDGEGKKWDKGKWEEKVKEMNKQLGVTEEQEQKLKEHREKNQAKMQTLRDQLKEKKEAIRQELEKTEFNEAQVKALQNEIKNLQNQKEDIQLEGILEVRKILSQEQFKKFSEKMKEHKGFGKGEKFGKHDGRKEDHEDHEDKDEK